MASRIPTNEFDGAIVAGVLVTRRVAGGQEYLCPDCGMSGEVRELVTDALQDLIDHKVDGECIGPVMRGMRAVSR